MRRRSRKELADSGLCEISIEMAQDIGLVPKPKQKSNRWIWEPVDKYLDYNIQQHQLIVDEYCTHKDIQTCIFTIEEVKEAKP